MVVWLEVCMQQRSFYRKTISHPYLNDSKQLTEKRRMILRKDIEKDAIAWAVGVVSPEEIDENQYP